jgi:hypothetical protein
MWKDRPSFLNWKESQKTVSHGTASGKGPPVGGDLVGRPELAYYEGKLTLLSPLGG